MMEVVPDEARPQQNNVSSSPREVNSSVVFDLAVEWFFLGLFFRSECPEAGHSIPKKKITTKNRAMIIKLDATIQSRNAAEVAFRKSIYKPNVTSPWHFVCGLTSHTKKI